MIAGDLVALFRLSEGPLEALLERSLVIAGFLCCFALCVGCVRKTEITGDSL